MVAARLLADRMSRPQRIGVFGHRGVGKTTLLTVLYREAVGGRLPGLRLAAGDARTADYLSDKILQLESGQPLPATLAETDLRFHLYHQGARLELLFKDYQGEHVEIGRAEPVRDFLRDCDAIWLCLDAGSLTDPAARLRREQEVEQLVEDYLALGYPSHLRRPITVVVTKADLLGLPLAEVEAQAAQALAMTLHALTHHGIPTRPLAISSLGRDGARMASPQPENLHTPLVWLAQALQAQDSARLQHLWATGAAPSVLGTCTEIFARRYPDSPDTQVFRTRLGSRQRSRRRRLGVLGAGVAACFMATLGAYDVLGRHAAVRFEADHSGDAAAALARWEQYRAWHPTRGLYQPSATRTEEDHINDLKKVVRQQERDARLVELRRQAGDLDADPEVVWRQFLAFRLDHPETDVDGDLQYLRDSLKARRDEQLGRRARQAHDALVSAEGVTSDLADLLAKSDGFLREFAGAAQEGDVRRRRDAYLARLDERDIELARAYSAQHPLNFQTRREHYQRYLDRHTEGAHRKAAEEALRAIAIDWDRNDFRQVRDQFLTKPGDVSELVGRCRSYLAIHPQGQFVTAANELLRWTEAVTETREYKVVLRSGHVEKKVARMLSRGPDLSVTVEVAGVRYGPSPIVANRYDPEWYYEFSRPIKWKMGDRVVIQVMDHDWKDRIVAEITSPDGDPLGMRLLSGETSWGGTRLTFESGFALPSLPKVE